jgi:cell volume regulation protein A
MMKRCMMVLEEFSFLAFLLLVGLVLLLVRRKAKGGQSLYKLALILLGTIIPFIPSLHVSTEFIQNIGVFLLIILVFELSMRITPENVQFKKKHMIALLCMFVVNFIVCSVLSIYLFNATYLEAFLFAIIITSVEYFMVDELKEEGDLANPLLLIFAFLMMYFYNLHFDIGTNIAFSLQHILIGIGGGVAFGVIVVKSIKGRKISWPHELGLIATAIIAYVVTGILGGSGLIAVGLMGILFGNSFVKKKSDLKTFSPFIYKSLEIFVYLLTGIVASLHVEKDILIKSALLFLIYIVIRFIIITFVYKLYSAQNRWLMTLAPKGMVFGIIIIVLGSFGKISSTLLSAMLLIMVYSLIISSVFEFAEKRKIARLDKLFEAFNMMRYGRKRNFFRKPFFKKQ